MPPSLRQEYFYPKNDTLKEEGSNLQEILLAFLVYGLGYKPFQLG